ncbi:MAG: hypothetical protein IT535_01800 [Bauldia sp.]|nr:hypothetical protein [Bauldia sp.]
MRSYLDSKAMAKTLRQALAERGLDIPHSAALELVARQFGVADWNTLAARIEAETDRELIVPEGWMATGEGQNGYRLGRDPDAAGVALIESRYPRGGSVDLAGTFATLMQSISAENYRGRRVQLQASLRAEDADLGTIWLRIDASPGNAVRFDNITERPPGPLRGTTDWTERSIVLDVLPEATSINYGFFLRGHGSVRARDFRLDVVGEDVPATRGRYREGPTNLGFQ